jgi:hypothetical protein
MGEQRSPLKMQPSLKPVPRRLILKLVAGGASAAVLGATGVGLLSWAGKEPQDGEFDSPARNPAFQETPAQAEGRVILYCHTGTGECLAYDLNAAGYLIWRNCLSHAEKSAGARRSVESIARRIAGVVDGSSVREFVDLLHARGLVHLGPSPGQAYFVYEGAH